MRITRSLLLVSVLLFMASANAQFKKGDRMVGTTLASAVFNSGSSEISVAQIGNNTSKITSYNLSISPSLGWFVSENTVVGGILTINPSGNKTTYEQNGSTFQSDKYNSFNIGLGGFVRHYLNSTGNMMPFGQFGFNVGISSLKTEGFFYGGTSPNAYKISYDGSSSGGFYANATIQAGLTKMVGDNAGLDLFIGYNYGYNKNTFVKTTLRDNGNDGTVDETLKNETTTKFTNHGILLGVGFQVFLRKKK
ncbi:MAG TPA: hypothetical protein VMZ03_11505 [Chitinophagaceae bacterium]|nr:hypothetical protein [Chitinophagaceae bacterium]